MSKTKASALTLVLACSGLLAACAGDPPKTSPANVNTASAPATNASKPADPKPVEMKVAGMPADTQPIFAAKCASCHGPDATGKPPAANILQVKDKHTSEVWQQYLANPKSLEKDSKMPPIQLTPDEAKKIGDWLAVTTGGGAAKK